MFNVARPKARKFILASLAALLLLTTNQAGAAPTGAKDFYLNNYGDPYPLDEDHDNDGVLNESDAFPKNPLEWTDTDGDGTGNNNDSDDDGDGMPDAYELSNNLNPLLSDGSADYDGDGSSNLQEFQNSTNPNNLLSCNGSSCYFAQAPAAATINYPSIDTTSDAIGAIAGSLNVSNSGAAEYTIPLYAPPGIAGVAPKLALQYRSNGGNGWLGEGWSVGAFSAITMCTANRAQDGFASRLGAGNDRFCLDGERLVRETNPNGNYSSADGFYRLESDRFTRIHSYSPGGNRIFQVWHKDGSHSFYGATDDSRLNLAGGLVWAISSTQDSTSYRANSSSTANPVKYTYYATVGNGSAASLGELRIKSIEYAFQNGVPNAAIEFNYVDRPDISKFIVQDTVYTRDKRIGSITVKSKVAGTMQTLRTYNLAYADVSARKNKNSKLTSITECRDSVCLPSTQFTWSDSGIDFQLTAGSTLSGFSAFPFTTTGKKKIQPADFNSDGFADLVWLEKVGANYKFNVSLSDGTTLAAATVQSSAAHDLDAWVVSDFDHDSYPDILFTVNGSLNLYKNVLSSGQRTLASTHIQLIANMDMGTEPTLDGMWFDPKGVFADINADGLMDVLYNKAIYYMVADPSATNGPYKFGSANVITLGDPSTTGTINEKIKTDMMNNTLLEYAEDFKTVDLDSAEIGGDFSGDGLPDLVVNGWFKWVNCGTPFMGAKVILASTPTGGFTYLNSFSLTPKWVSGACGPYGQLKGRPTLLGDLNSDGISDVTYLDYYTNNGYSWSSRLSWHGAAGAAYPSVGDPSYATDASFQDINQDGLPDLVYRLVEAGDDQLRVLYNDRQGSFFYAGGGQIATVAGTDLGNHLFMDINGDGILDFVDLASKVWLGNKANGTAWGKITKITNGLGEETNITYDRLTNSAVYTRESDALTLNLGYPVFDVFAPITVVSATSRSAPTAESASNVDVTSYKYQGLKVQPAGRGWLGFRVIKTVDNETGNLVSNSFRQDFPFTGLIADTQSYVSGQTTALSETTNTYAKLSHINGLTTPPYYVALTQSVTTQRVAESSANASTPSLMVGGVLTTTTTTQSGFDSYGNVGSINVSVTGDGSTHTTTTANTYSNDGSNNWLIGRLTQSIVSRQMGSSTLTRRTDYTYDSYGRLSTEVREPQGAAAVKLTTSYEYDAVGNPIKITETSGATTRYSRTVYDAFGRFVDKTYNGLEQLVSEVTQRDVYGNAEVVKGLNGIEHYARFGTFGRQYFSASNDGMAATTLYRSCASVSCLAGASFRVQTTGVDGSLANVYMDKLGREVRSETRGFGGTLSLVDTQYDAAGRVKRVSAPYFSGDTVYWNTSDYDHLNRVIKVTDAANGVSTNYFSRYVNGTVVGVQQLSTNQLNQTKTTITDGVGQTIKVIDNLSGFINYTYDAAGNLTELNANGVISAITYDVLGRRITLDDPDQGQWEYLYNAFGEMTDQEDSGGGLTHIDFDGLGRMSQRRDYTSGMVMESDTRWTYGTSPAANNVGQVIQEQDLVSDYLKVSAYDAKGRIRQTITSLGIDGADGDYPEYQTYDQYGRKFQTIDATAKGVQHVYNANGYLEKLVEASNTSKVYHTVTQTNARGQVTGEAMMGTAFQMARGYSPQTGLATSIVATSSQYTPTPSGATLLDISLNFDAAGNLTGRTRQVKATSSLSARTLTETFTYDQLNRLTQIAATGQSTLNLSYDGSGNILTKSGVGSYSYGAGSAGPHAVTSAGGATYTYDAIGNMLTGDGRTAVYNAFRKPVSVTKGSNTTTFNYAPDRSHYKRVDNSGASITTTITVGNVEFIKVGANPVTTKRYISGVAMITDNTATGHEEHVILTDHLGSTAAIAKHTALDLQQMDYDAFGKRRNLWTLDELAQAEFSSLNQLTTTGFTGHEMLDGVGLIHMQGRVFDPKLGRFMSADPYITELDNTQNMNRYSYVYNNPLTLVDPSGFGVGDSPPSGTVNYNGVPSLTHSVQSGSTDLNVHTFEGSGFDDPSTCYGFDGCYGSSSGLTQEQIALTAQIIQMNLEFARAMTAVMTALGSTVDYEAEFFPEGDPFEALESTGILYAQVGNDVIGVAPTNSSRDIIRTEPLTTDQADDIYDAMADMLEDLRNMTPSDRLVFFDVKMGNPIAAGIMAEAYTQALARKLQIAGAAAIPKMFADVLGDEIKYYPENKALDLIGSHLGGYAEAAIEAYQLVDTVLEIKEIMTISNDGYGVTCVRADCVLLTPTGALPFKTM